jgi:hypothetical protein
MRDHGLVNRRGIHVQKPPVDGIFRLFQLENGVGFLVSPVFFVVLQVDLGILFCVFVYGLIILVTPQKWSLPPLTIEYKTPTNDDLLTPIIFSDPIINSL